MPDISKICPQCGETFIGRPNQKFCKRFGVDKCKDDHNNARKSAPRRNALVAQGGICAYPACHERATRFHADLKDGGRALCDFHSADYSLHKRAKARGSTELECLIADQQREMELEAKGIYITWRMNGWYHGRLHVSLDDPKIINELVTWDSIDELIERIDIERDGSGWPDLAEAA
jgi:hypothetical protein